MFTFYFVRSRFAGVAARWRSESIQSAALPGWPENVERSNCLLIAADGVSCRAWAIKCPRRGKAPFAPKPRDKFFTRGGGSGPPLIRPPGRNIELAKNYVIPSTTGGARNRNRNCGI